MVIGFLKFEDFIEEAKAHQPDVIRVQKYFETTPSTNTSLTLFQFWLVAAFSVNGDTYVCRLNTGKDWNFEEKKIEQLDRRNEKMEIFLRGLIKTELPEAQIRRGIITAANEDKTSADATFLINMIKAQ